MADYWDIITDEALDAGDLEERFNEFLDETFNEIAIWDCSFSASTILQALDPIAWQEYFNDWVDGEIGNSITDVEPDRDEPEPWPYEAEEEAYQDLL